MGSASQNNLGQWAKTPDAVSQSALPRWRQGFGGGCTKIPRPHSVALLLCGMGGTVLPLLFPLKTPIGSCTSSFLMQAGIAT